VSQLDVIVVNLRVVNTMPIWPMWANYSPWTPNSAGSSPIILTSWSQFTPFTVLFMLAFMCHVMKQIFKIKYLNTIFKHH
jgi:hypothetical protein